MKTNFPKLKFALKFKYSKRIARIFRVIFWFSVGALLAFFFVTSFGLFAYQKLYENKVYQGIYIGGTNFGGQTKQDIKNFFSEKNSQIASSAITSGISLHSTYAYDQNRLLSLLKPISQKIEKKPVNAIFKFENNRVTTFQPSENGQTLDTDLLNRQMLALIPKITAGQTLQTQAITLPIKILTPEITTEKVNNMGIKELIGTGNSYFYHSIPGRIHNVALATSRISGALIAPGETFSFDKTLGDVSAFTGYQQAYVIQNGKTVLGDGGGVCQVSTTFFRALLSAGLPIVERHAHAYRVGYYEENGYPPGIDATVFVPSVDLKFLNDTGHYILVQSKIDLDNLYLEFDLYGTSDGRTVSMTTPVVTNQVAPPPDLYQDDPTLPAGQIKQTDFAAWGADVSFTRTVTRNGKVIISDKYISNYQPWQAIYLRGTQ
jgi:vancomycin resistance protein YoaR